MKVRARARAAAAPVSACLGSAPTAFADTAKEVHRGRRNDGKTMADFEQMIGKLEGGDEPQASLLTPDAARDLSVIPWVWEMPDAVGLAALQSVGMRATRDPGHGLVEKSAVPSGLSERTALVRAGLEALVAQEAQARAASGRWSPT